jgi:hypothetical protein
MMKTFLFQPIHASFSSHTPNYLPLEDANLGEVTARAATGCCLMALGDDSTFLLLAACARFSTSLTCRRDILQDFGNSSCDVLRFEIILTELWLACCFGNSHRRGVGLQHGVLSEVVGVLPLDLGICRMIYPPSTRLPSSICPVVHATS